MKCLSTIILLYVTIILKGFILFHFHFICIHFCLHIFLCTAYMTGVWRGQKSMLNLLELDYSTLLAVVESVSATWIFWKTQQSSNCWAFFSIPDATIINYIFYMRITKFCKSKVYFTTSVHINRSDYPDTNCIVPFPFFTLSLFFFSLSYTIKFHFAIIHFYYNIERMSTKCAFP